MGWTRVDDELDAVRAAGAREEALPVGKWADLADERARARRGGFARGGAQRPTRQASTPSRSVTMSSRNETRSSGIVTSAPRRPICTMPPAGGGRLERVADPRLAAGALDRDGRSADAAVPHGIDPLRPTEVANPSSRATASRCPSWAVPLTTTLPPASRASWAASRPIAPGPTTSTASPVATTGGSSSELQTHASGSQSDAAASESSSGTGCRFRTGSSTRDAKAPSTCVPSERRSAQRLRRPSRQSAQRSHVEK